MPHNNLGTFHDTTEARVIATAKDSGAAEPLHVTQAQWEKNKAEIKRLYLIEDRSLVDTMQYMESLGFAASIKLYKDKLKEWMFLKNLPGETAYWVINHDQERKSAGKDTRYRFGERELTLEQAQKSAARYEQRSKLPPATSVSVAAPQTPAEISYATPSACAASPFYVSLTTPATPSHLDKGKGTEEGLWYPRFTSDGKPKSYYDDLVSEAEQFSGLGQRTEALEKYQNALAGYRNMFSPTHDLIISVVYKVAHLHMELDDTKAADHILESATKAHVREHGLWDNRTVQHISQLIKMLEGWNRQNEALPLVLHLLQGQEHEPYSTFPSSTVSVSFDAAGIQRDVAIANMLAPVMDETTTTRLVALAQLCEARPVDFPKQTLDVWAALLRNYKEVGDDVRIQNTLDRAANSINEFSNLGDSAWTTPVFLSLISLMQLFLAFGRQEFVDEVLLTMEEQIEYTLDSSSEDMVDLLTIISSMHKQPVQKLLGVWMLGQGPLKTLGGRSITNQNCC
ncbi:hypothetical protein J4E80_000832 [Alternaria sp. BMP 0032]|nr:hypothetical protein J4E80_000832 [Alternaria sp. BMP 0032]